MRIHQPGNIAVDPANGRPLRAEPDSLYTVYVETNGPAIRWTVAYVDGQVYTVRCYPVEKMPHEAGMGKQSGKKIMLAVSKGNRLWRLDLIPSEVRRTDAVKRKGETIILEGKRGNKKTVLRIAEPVELESIPSV